MKPSTLDSKSGLFGLVDNRAALLAAQRLAEQSEAGLRFCCEHREKLTVVEARKRDQADAARRAKYQQSMAELEQRLETADRLDEVIASSGQHAPSSELDEDFDLDDRTADDEMPESFEQTLFDDDDMDSLEMSEDFDEVFA